MQETSHFSHDISSCSRIPPHRSHHVYFISAVYNLSIPLFYGRGIAHSGFTSTATGSTGYSMAAGGPILHPGVEAIVVNPICPMSLSSRPLVVPPRAQLAVWPLGEASRRVRLWKDGTHATVLEPGDRCDVRRAPDSALMVLLEQNPSYYRTLSHKLHWAGSLTAAEPSPN